MKLLVVVPFPPYPPRTGNTLIIYNQTMHLSLRHRVDLVSFMGPGVSDRSSLGELADRCGEVELIEPPSRAAALLNRLRGFTAERPLQVSACRSRPMQAAVARRLHGGGYDAALFHMTQTAQFRPAGYRGAALWSLEDPLVLKYDRLLDDYPPYLRPVLRFRNARRRQYEARQAARFDRVLLLNEADARDYAQVMPAARLDWVPYGVDIEAFRPDGDVTRRPGMIVITGNMYHPPNARAAVQFCQEVFPLVRERVPSANLWLVGADPTNEVRLCARGEQIRVTGFVPDIKPFLRQAMVSVCAVRLAIGTQTKVLEAMACGTPVVTTSAGNRGVQGVSGEHLYIAESPADMAEAVTALLNGQRWAALSESGRRFVVQNFTWELSVGKLECILEESIAEAARRPPTLSERRGP